MKRGSDDLMAEAAAAGVSTVLCCSCGVPMIPNQTMRCAQCLKAEVDITDGIPRQNIMPHCRTCNRYQKPPWTAAEPESRELLGMCLKRVKGIGRDVRLVDAQFIWTEEHSKRIKVKATVQKEIANGTVLQQSLVLEFIVQNLQCEDCQKSFTPHTWNACVQVRQKVTHRRTFCYLEQLILKHDAHEKVLGMKETREGLDFHFAQRSHAQRFADFIQSQVPCKFKHAKQLVGHDSKSNTYNYKYTTMVDLCPICVDDIVYVPKSITDLLTGAPPVLVCHKISTTIHLLDPLTLKGYDIPTAQYWKNAIDPMCTRSNLTEFMVLNVEKVPLPEMGSRQKHHMAGRQKMGLADVEVARMCDLGANDDRLTVRTHLGSILRPGDYVLGYDLRTVNCSGDTTDAAAAMQTDAIFVRKNFKRKKERQWDLQRLQRDKEEGDIDINDAGDMEALKQQLEEDAELRKGVNMFRQELPAKKVRPPQAAAEDIAVPDEDDDLEEEEDAPEVPLAELLEGLELNAGA